MLWKIEYHFDHREAIEEHYRLPKEEPLIALHLECLKKGLIYNDDDNAPEHA